MSQSRARTCDFLTRTIFFYSQLHAIFCAFYSRFSINVYASGTVAPMQTFFTFFVEDKWIDQCLIK